MSATAEIFVVTGPGHGHLHPCMELCLHLTRRRYLATLVIPSHLSSAIPPSFASNPLVAVAQIAGTSGPPMRVSDPLNQPAGQDLSAHLEKRTAGSEPPRVLCAVVDFQVGWTKDVFWKFDVPVISFVTFGACAAAMELGAWRVQAGDVRPGEARSIPGLPEEMAVTYSDLKRKPFGPPRGGPPGPGPRPGGGGGGPPKPGDRPPWVPEVEGSIGLMFNTCADLERPFLDYMGDQMKMPVWGVGPLLPEQYWKKSDSLISDREIRRDSRESNCTEDEVIQWLDRKPRRSVLYVAFGSEVGPDEEELAQLAAALEESTTGAFIWVIGSKSGGGFSDGMEGRVGDRGLIIRGWAPQLLILSHPSTGGFLSHCGWNSTAEAVGRGVPLLAWPIRGDQHYNAKLAVSHLKVGYRVAEDLSRAVKKDEIAEGIERLMLDEEMHERAASIKAKFGHGFPASSESALDAFRDFINQRL
ncbi:UDP-glycosyltransferase 73E1-like [Rhodamnia argentea]|uniref:Glycosyltransferase n=1 Tax=Rhodamnia argentea TaxID=178133 RepID=A0A8B8R532_9MYRT|nr:UDP-glycosyltransferase 73E1-like [Rhodamnia argentea]